MGDEYATPLLLVTRTAGRGTPLLSPERPISRSTTKSGREYKVVVVGSAGVGKTSLVKREALGEFDPSPQLSLGTEKHVTSIEISNEPVQLVLYDTIGQERFRTISTTLYRNAHAVLMCFDVANRTSFEALEQWYMDVERNAPRDALILLIATKVDVPKRTVSQDEGKAKAQSLGVHLVETSAKNGYNVKALFALIASALSGERRLLPQSSFTAPPSPILTSIKLDKSSSRRFPELVASGKSGSSTPTSTDSSTSPSDPEASSCWGGSKIFRWPFYHSPPVIAKDEDPGSPGLYQQSTDIHIPTPEAGLSLAEVIVEHANQRARLVSGGLRRRNTLDAQEIARGDRRRNSTFDQGDSVYKDRRDRTATLDPFIEELTEAADDVVDSISTVATGTPAPLKLIVNDEPSFRLCDLGCGAVLDEDRTDHETLECWLRRVPCSLGCGRSFPMLDCVAHERESCELRHIKCTCGSRIQAKDFVHHSMSFQGRSISTWTSVDVVHFILSVVPQEQDRKSVNFAKILGEGLDGTRLMHMRGEEQLGLIIPHSKQQIKILENALGIFTFVHSTTSNGDDEDSSAPSSQHVLDDEGLSETFSKRISDPEYSLWEATPRSTTPRDHEGKTTSPHGPTKPHVRGTMLGFQQQIVSSHRLKQLSTGSVWHQLRPSSTKTAVSLPIKDETGDNNNDSLTVEEVDGAVGESTKVIKGTSTTTFGDLWSTWHQQANMGEEGDGMMMNSIASLQSGHLDEEFTREVLVPLALGNKTVAVRTIRFKDLQLNSMDLVGAGSYGSVYLGRYRGAQVAVKRLHFQGVEERDLLREAALMISVSGHPHILRFLGVCLERPNICFVSEALKWSLEDWLRRDRQNRAEPLSELLRYAEEAASGLYHLHLEMVVHRDIAARNLLLDSGNPRRVKVCDFGLARVLPRRTAPNPLNTMGGDQTMSQLAVPQVGGSLQLMGPLRWMSPESLRPGNDGLTRFSFASDVYSFAITVWELLSRDTPYPTLQPHEAALGVLMEDLRPPKARMSVEAQRDLTELLTHKENSKCVTQLVALLERAWDKDPVKRPTMKQLVRELSLLREACADAAPVRETTRT